MREEFEKLPEIAELVNDFDFSEDTNTYHIRYDDMDDDKKRLDVMFLGGAWYAYQEQQKNISVKDELKELYRKEVDFLRNQTSKAILALYSEDKEDALNILKESIKEWPDEPTRPIRLQLSCDWFPLCEVLENKVMSEIEELKKEIEALKTMVAMQIATIEMMKNFHEAEKAMLIHAKKMDSIGNLRNGEFVVGELKGEFKNPISININKDGKITKTEEWIMIFITTSDVV